jgi:hypothetical protein
MTLDQIKTREDAMDFLDGYAAQTSDEVKLSGRRRPLVKSYLLETVPNTKPEPDLETVFRRRGHTLVPLDNSLFQIKSNADGDVIGLLEKLLPRHPVIYTTRRSQEMDAWVRKLVDSSPTLDNLWISGRAFDQLQNIILATKPGHRFGRIVFQHQSIFELNGVQPQEDQDDDESETDDETAAEQPSSVQEDEDDYVPERRSSRFMVIDRLDKLRTLVPEMRRIYNSFQCISQLRFPARGTGGHDFYHNGKATNRSESFVDHRQHVKFVLQIYKESTETTERAAWNGIQKSSLAAGSSGEIIMGAPVLLQFKEPLSQSVFDQFIQATFRRKRNVFRLWGNPIQMGPRKVHVYALDRHLWQPLYLEITDRQIVVIVPRGTCGNSIHRLVTNVQQFLDPEVTVWIGDRSYDDLIKSATTTPKIYED